MFNWLFGRPTPEREARTQLHEAKMQLLQARYFEEHYCNSAAMLEQRIARLEQYLNVNEMTAANVRRLAR